MRTVNRKSDGRETASSPGRGASKLRHVIYSSIRLNFFLREQLVCQRKNGWQDDQLQGGAHQVPIVETPQLDGTVEEGIVSYSKILT
jgi:hypothetical protein